MLEQLTRKFWVKADFSGPKPTLPSASFPPSPQNKNRMTKIKFTLILRIC